jgi:hypothetical protein
MPVFDVTIVGKAYLPDAGQGLPGNQPGLWPGRPPYVDIGFPGPQPGGPVYPSQGLPGNQPYPDNSLPGQPPRPWGPINYPDQGLPGNQPIAGQPLPGNQPGLWPINPPYVDIGFPGPQPGGPVRPTHPIVVPPGIWGGSGEPFPNPPVYIPIPPPGSTDVPSTPINTPPTDSPYWMQVFLPNVGWVWAIIPKPPTGGEESVPLAR